jgi:DNA (cytosine-5)-methyltransferase 1
MSWLISQAMMDAYGNLLSSQEQVEEYLVDICSDGEQSVQLNGKPTQQAYLSQDKMTKYSRLSQFGMTYKPLTENRGEELLTLYLEGFHVKIFQPLGKEMDLTENGQECGERWQGLLARYDPNTHSLRTVQCSLLEDLNECLQIWPRWGSMRNGECFQQPILEQIIKETEFGLLPNNETFFHTPCTTGLDGGSNGRKALKKRLEKFPTPISDDAHHRTNPAQLRRQTLKLSVMAAHNIWPTPQSNDAKNAVVRHRTKSLQVMLGGAVATLDTQAIGGHLNPTWVEWLMGWPLEWTDLKPLEMDKSHFVQQPHGTSLKEE